MTINETYIELDGLDCDRLVKLLRANGIGWPTGLEGHGRLIESMQEPGQVLKITTEDVGGKKKFTALMELIPRPE